MIPPYDAWAIRRTLIGHDLNGELAAVSEPFRPIAEFLSGLAKDSRPLAWESFLCARPDRDAIVNTLADVDPLGPAPGEEEVWRPANVADLRKNLSDVRWVWEGWIPDSRICGIGAFEGIGKTRLALDLARRIYYRLSWPDGQGPTFPAGTPTLWICADGNQDDLAAAVQAMGLPDEAVHFNTSPDDPYGGTDLDDPEALDTLEKSIVAVRPGLVFIDTLTNATRRDLCRQNEVKALMGPLQAIAQRHRVSIIPQLHLSKEGQALGRRIKGITRTLIQLDCPDPEQPARLKLWVEKSFDKKPPPLGVTMGDAGNEYDFEPPTGPAPGRGGRPPEARDKARQFIIEALTEQNDQTGNDLCAAWEKTGGSSKTFWRAKDELVAEGRLTTDGGPGTRKQMILHLNREAKTEEDAPKEDPDRLS